jgi:hypothetical protein
MAVGVSCLTSDAADVPACCTPHPGADRTTAHRHVSLTVLCSDSEVIESELSLFQNLPTCIPNTPNSHLLTPDKCLKQRASSADLLVSLR